MHSQPPRNNMPTNTRRPIVHMAQTDGDGILPLPDAKDRLSNFITLTGTDYD